jgi:hypothetical protein
LDLAQNPSLSLPVQSPPETSSPNYRTRHRMNRDRCIDGQNGDTHQDGDTQPNSCSLSRVQGFSELVTVTEVDVEVVTIITDQVEPDRSTNWICRVHTALPLRKKH